jgi:rhodanese-related sulfurtransferase
MRFTIVTTLVATCLVLTGCASEAPSADLPDTEAATGAGGLAVETPVPGQAVAVAGGEYRDIIVPELRTMLERKDFALVNVHVPFAGDLPDTDESIRYDEMSSNLDRLPADKSAPIVLYCRTGPMSARAAQDLVALGYTNVYNLVGGFTAWVEAGLPLVTEQ